MIKRIKPEELKEGRRVKTIERGRRLEEPRVINDSEKCKATKRDMKRCTAKACEGEFCRRHTPKKREENEKAQRG